jgi:hypothetical protein
MDGADSRLLSGSVAIPSPPQPRRLVQSFHAALQEGLADAVRRPAARSRARLVTRDETNRSSAAATTTADPTATATTTSPDEDGVAVLAVNSVHDVLQERLDKAVQKGQVVDLTDDSPPLPRKPLKTTRDARGHEIIWLDDDDDGDEEDVLVEENDSSSSTAAAVPSIPNERATAECTACLASIRSTARPLLCTTCDQMAQIVPPPRALPAVLAQILHPGRDSTITSERDKRAARRQSSNNAAVEEFASAPKRSRRDNRGTVQECVEDILHP